MFEYQQTDSVETRQFLISFYKRQYLTFTDIGIGGLTKFGVEITEKLIQCTANRLDQIETGEKTFKNMCQVDRMMSMLGKTHGDVPEGEPAFINSNRSFSSHITSKFHTLDLGKDNRLSLEYHQGNHFSDNVNNATHYIDNISTAYSSEIMQAILSHDN